MQLLTCIESYGLHPVASQVRPPPAAAAAERSCASLVTKLELYSLLSPNLLLVALDLPNRSERQPLRAVTNVRATYRPRPSTMSDDDMEQQKPHPGISTVALLGILAAHFTIFVALTTLLVLTLCHEGFARSPTTNNVFLNYFGMDWDVLWQSVPTFVVSLFAQCRNWKVDEAIYHISRADIEKKARKAASSNHRSKSFRGEESASQLGKLATRVKSLDERTFSKTLRERPCTTRELQETLTAGHKIILIKR